jgi:RNA polymerase sigma-70 factor (ECF subfamily)
MDRHEFRDFEAARSEFVQLLTKAQIGLLRYITVLVGNPDEATNILQETNLLLWEKMAEFELGTNFEAWATKIAYWQVKAYIRDRSRDRLVFSEDIVSQLAERLGAARDMDATITALRTCLKGLRDSDHNLLRLRYDVGFSIQRISGHLGKSPSAVKGALLRARRVLRNCIETRLLRET